MIQLSRKLITLSPAKRLLNYPRPIIALTGGIASGKSTVSRQFETLGMQIVCADSIIKEIYSQVDTLEFITKLCPEAITNQQIDFPRLRELFFTNSELRDAVENFIFSIFPDLLKDHFDNIVKQNFILYDVPLLFEKGLDHKVDSTVCVYTSSQEQLQRVKQRDNSTEELAKKIIADQISMEKKKEQANYVIHNTGSIEDLNKETMLFFQSYFFTA